MKTRIRYGYGRRGGNQFGGMEYIALFLLQSWIVLELQWGHKRLGGNVNMIVGLLYAIKIFLYN